MTPAPISVERLRELLAADKAWRCTGDDMRCADGNGCECEMKGVGRPDLATAMHEALPALLQQLAEREAECDRLREYVCEADRRVGEQFMVAQRAEANALRTLNKCGEAFDRTRAAERAREEATGLLRRLLGAKWCTPEYEQARVASAAFLAASGGA